MILSNIVIYENYISAVDYMNQKLETKEKWNQINVLSMESMLRANCRIPLLHMSKSYIWIEEKSQRINEFSFGYMFNPTLYTNKFLKSKWKHILKTHLVQIPTNILIKHYKKQYKSACISCFLWAWEYHAHGVNVSGQLSYAIIIYVKKLHLNWRNKSTYQWVFFWIYV